MARPGPILLAMTTLLLPPGGARRASAVPAAPLVVTLEQADGTRFDARPRGDEWRNWMETADGHAIVRRGSDWYYAERAADGALAASALRVAPGPAPAEAAFSKGLLPAPVEAPSPLAQPPFAPRRDPAKALAVTQPLLVILVSFSDTSFIYPASSFQTLLFGTSRPSVRHFYLETSYSNFTIAPAAESQGTANDGLVSVALTTAHPNFGSNFGAASSSLVSSALTAANPFVNFAAFDTDASGGITPSELAILLIVAGYENSYGGTSSKTPRIWAHASGITPATLDGVQLSPYAMFGERHAVTSAADHQATIGVMCHELGHLLFGLPDLYDTDGSSNGVGDWCLMGGGSWNRTGSFIGDSPAHFSAWCKGVVSFLAHEDVAAPQSNVLLASASTTAATKRLWIDPYRSNEFFLVENRTNAGYDAGLPATGVLLWHVDQTRTGNADENRKLVDLEEADGLRQLDLKQSSGDAGDPYPGSTSNLSFADATNPNSRDAIGGPTGISVSGFTPAGQSMSLSLVPRAIPFGNVLGYDDRGVTGYGLGYNTATVWTAIRFTNSTAQTRIDGFELYMFAAGTVDAYLYSSIPGGTPSGLLHTRTGFSASAGWNRVFFATPQNFPAAQDRVLVLRIQAPGQVFPAAYDPVGPISGRCWVDDDGSGAYFQLTSFGDLHQHLLLSSPSSAHGWVVR